jgi:hypothetical protein
MTLHLHIDRVVIDAATDGRALDRARLEDSIRRELAERITADGLPARLRVSSARDTLTRNTLTGSAAAGNTDRSPGGAPRAQDHAAGAGASADAARASGRGIGRALYGSFHR